MKPLLAGALVLAAAVSAASAAEIPAGTHLLLRMEHSVSSRTAKVGDGVHLRTSIPLSAGGRIIVPLGSYAQGVISSVKPAGRNHVRAEMQIQLVTLMLPSGEVLKISPKTTSTEAEIGAAARGRQGPPAWPPGVLGPGGGLLGPTLGGLILGGRAGAGVGMAVGVAAVLIPALIARGREVELRQGMAVDVVFDSPAVLQ